MTESMPRLLLDAGRTRRNHEWAAVQRRRLRESVAHARAHSPYYRDLYRGLPDGVDDPAALPVTDKKALMADYDRWAGDREVTLERARAFVADPELIGARFLGRYLVVTTSGTTGNPAIFIKDEQDIAVNYAMSARMMGSWLNARDITRILAGGGRMAIVAARNGHFMVSAGAARMRAHRLQRKAIRLFSVHAPLAELVAELNAFRPALLLGYGSVLRMLAAEQEAGRLRVAPVLVEPAGETLTEDDYALLGRAFGAKVRDTYGASECPFLTEGCAHGWYHVNGDWVLAEPVEADYSPTPPGEQSHTVLVTNLANRVQPILRYDLGDSVLQRPDPCPCGNPLPALRVRGRVANVLTFEGGPGGGSAVIAPLMLNTLVDRTPGVQLYQIVQTGPRTLRVRLRVTPGADPDTVWREVCDGIAGLLAEHGLDHVILERATEPPEQSHGGKYRTVVPLKDPHDARP
ncbi:phenylacetate--CoA ligase family protein [Nonomuraea phyllanthi]|uniref:Phenylacetate--CoA ligase family protein n=1 Tax=Nonomuraea phyllanthi TaxID=2219224 RepID=A0A5C4VJ56_9ACTN|nr:phenylacetate--CoA ligase family protein [Nonomuraea phyllanthi]KAB8189151.1 phenylacetate--CoA ligase family protein [Nonomuraea phyllanthi]